MPDWFRQQNDGLSLSLHIQPGAKRSEIVGLHGDALKVRLAAPPVEGKANAALLRFLAERFQVPSRNIELVQGAQSRQKVVLITGTFISPLDLLESSKSA